MNWLTWLQSFDSSSFILRILDQHWLILGFAWGSFRIIAKRTKTTADDEFVEVVNGLRNRRKEDPN